MYKRIRRFVRYSTHKKGDSNNNNNVVEWDEIKNQRPKHLYSQHPRNDVFCIRQDLVLDLSFKRDFFHCCSLKPFRIFLFLFLLVAVKPISKKKNSNSFITSHIHYTSQKFNPDGFQSSVNIFYAATSNVAALPLNKKKLHSMLLLFHFSPFPRSLYFFLCFYSTAVAAQTNFIFTFKHVLPFEM